ncbi:unnamed protein product [Ectocarpus sp. CCAP 1310/34]|nr:unnamed protein product [Ectocarpus sp. CCAP 1310/34]
MRREVKNYTVHYNKVTNEQGQPKSGQQNGDVMLEVIEKGWNDQVEEAATKKMKETRKKQREALERKAKQKSPN